MKKILLLVALLAGLAASAEADLIAGGKQFRVVVTSAQVASGPGTLWRIDYSTGNEAIGDSTIAIDTLAVAGNVFTQFVQADWLTTDYALRETTSTQTSYENFKDFSEMGGIRFTDGLWVITDKPAAAYWSK